MANTGFKGIDVAQTGYRVLSRASLKDVSGNAVTTGPTTYSVYEWQDDATIKTYDFNDGSFKAGAVGAAVATAFHRAANNGTLGTGLWSAVLSGNSLSGFTAGARYVTQFTNSAASPAQQEREWQYGSAQGDLAVTPDPSGTVGLGFLQSDVKAFAGVLTVPSDGAVQSGSTSTTVKLASTASAQDNFYVGSVVYIIRGVGSPSAAGQSALVTGYNGTTKVATIAGSWVVTPSAGDEYVIQPATVVTAALSAGAVTTAAIANGAITDAKFTLPDELAGSPTGFMGLVMWVAGMFGWRKVVKDSGAGTIVLYQSDNTTPKTTSAYTSSGGVDTINKAT